jgi:hypothetical protein
VRGQYAYARTSEVLFQEMLSQNGFISLDKATESFAVKFVVLFDSSI